MCVDLGEGVILSRTFIQEIEDNAPIRQGDIICRQVREPRGVGRLRYELGVIVTADCDIAQEKMGPFFTYVSIIPATSYLESFWAYEELQKLKLKCGSIAQAAIFDADRQRDPSVDRLSLEDLSNWVQRSSPEVIARAVGVQVDRNKQAMQSLEVLSLIGKSKEGPLLETLRSCWSLLGRSSTNQQSAVEAALEQRQMRSEYIFVPSIPNCEDRGFVITLRDIRSVPTNDVFGSLLTWRLKANDEGMYRLGRFSDAFRYSVAQKLAFLFSRIGLSAEFEAECKRVSQEVSSGYASQ